MKQLSGTDAGAIYVYSNLRQKFRLRATYGMSEEMIGAIGQQTIRLGDGPIGEAAVLRKPVQVADLREGALSPAMNVVYGAGYRALLSIPLIRLNRGQQRERGFSWWPWRERSSGQLIGLIGLNAAEIDGEPAVEVGWSVRRARWGEGFAVEAARASLDWGFERCDLDEIVSFTMVTNERSRRVMDKLGLEYVRDFDRIGLPHVLYRARR